MLNPTHLHTLRRVLQAGSFAEAAATLGYTASAVSQQIAALERASGMVLFERDGRSSRPTEAARLIAERAEPVLASLDALEREIRALASHDRGLVRVGSFPTASATIIPHALAQLRRGRPRVTVQIGEGEPDELVPVLEAGGLDIALVFRYDSSPRRWPADVVAIPLITEDLFVLLPAGTAMDSGAGLQLRDLRDATWIATRESTGGEQALLQLAAAAGFAPRIDHRTNDFGVVSGLVRAGIGVAIVPALAIVNGHPGIRAIQLSGDAPRRRIFALFHNTKTGGLLTPVVEAVVEASRYLQQLPGLSDSQCAKIEAPL